MRSQLNGRSLSSKEDEVIILREEREKKGKNARHYKEVIGA